MNEEIKQQIKELCQTAWEYSDKVTELKSNPAIARDVHAQRRLNQVIRSIADSVDFLLDVTPVEQEILQETNQRTNGGNYTSEKSFRGQKRRQPA